MLILCAVLVLARSSVVASCMRATMLGTCMHAGIVLCVQEHYVQEQRRHCIKSYNMLGTCARE